MTDSQTELDDLKGRFIELDRFRSSLQKLADEFTSLRQAAETVLGRLHEHDQFVDSRKDEVKQLLAAASDTIRTFEGRKEDLIREIQTVLNQVQGSFNRLSSEIGTRAVETINATSLQIFQLRKSLLEFTEKKSEELKAALSAFEGEIFALKAEHQQALGRLPAVGEEIQQVEGRLKEAVLSCQATMDSLREKAEISYRETRGDIERLDQRLKDDQTLLEQTRRDIGIALERNRGEIFRLQGESQQKWDHLSAGYADMRGALDIVESSRRQYERTIETLGQEIEEGLRRNAEGMAVLSASFGERVEGIQAEYRHHMAAMLERVESATKDTEQTIGGIRQEIENTLKESSDRVSGFLISSEEKINELKLNYYQTRAAIDRLERTQQESDKAASASRIEVAEALRESRHLLSEFEAATTQKIEDMKSAHRRELDTVLSRLDMVRRESDSVIARARKETEQACKDRLDQIAGLFQSSEEKLDGLRSEQLSIKVSLDQAERSREDTDRSMAALSGDLSEALRRTREEAASLFRGVEDRLNTLHADYEALKASVRSFERSPEEAAAELSGFKEEIGEVLRTQKETTTEKYDALCADYRRGFDALREEIEAVRGQCEGSAENVRDELSQTILLARQEMPELAQRFERRFEEIQALQDGRIRGLSATVEALKQQNERALAIDDIRGDLSGARAELSRSASETGSIIRALREEMVRLNSATGSQIPILRSETEARIGELRSEFHRDVEEILGRVGATARENDEALAALKHEVESSFGDTARRLAHIEDASAEHLAKASFERLKEIAAFREALDRSCQDSAQFASTMKDEVEKSLSRYAERLSNLNAASEERFAASQAAHQSLKDEMDRLNLARDETDRDLKTLREHVVYVASEAAKPLSELASKVDARLNETEAACRSEVSAIREDLASLRSDQTETARALEGHIAGLSGLRNEVARALEERTAAADEKLDYLRSECLKETDMVLDRVETVRLEEQSAIEGLRQEIAERVAHEAEEVRQLFQGTEAQLAELRAGTNVITTVLDRVERLKEDNEKAFGSIKQEVRQAVSARVDELAADIGSTQETVELLKSRYLELQAFVEAIEGYRLENEQAVTAFKEEIEQQLRNYLTGLGGQIATPAADVDSIRAGYQSIQEKVSEALNETRRIQGELQEEIHYRTRETREQLTGLIERRTHQFKESFTTLVEHKDTMLRSAVFGAVKKQRTFMLLLFLMSVLMSFALFYFGKR